MKYIKEKVLKLNLDKTNNDKVEDIAKKLVNFYLDFGGRYNEENSEEIFDNHLVSLAKRINEKNLLEDEDITIGSQISQDSYNLAKEMISKVLIEYYKPVSKLEIVLLAIHIDLNKGENICQK